MSNLTKSAELAELKELHSCLKEWETAQKRVRSCEEAIRAAESKSPEDVHVHQASTDQYKKEYRKYTAEQEKKKSAAIGRFLTVAVVILAIMGICWLCMSGVFAKDTYLHTPEIVREYSGVYYTVSGHCTNCKLTITACDEEGVFDGNFEFFGEDQYSGKDVYGKYSIRGQIATKSLEGYVNATLKFKEWIDHPSGYNPLNDMKIKIYDDYQAIRGFDYDMCLYASEREQPASVADLNTPEIIGTYSGEFTPNTGKVGTASITIDSCDSSGQVTGVFEYTFEQGIGKWTLTGQIVNKYSDGSVILTLKPGDAIANSYMFYYPSTMEIEIYNDYRSVESREGMHFFYEDEGFKEDPNPVKTPVQQMVNKVAPIAFPAYIGVVLVILLILASKRTNVFTEEQQRKLNQLQHQDNENKIKNEEARKKKIAQAQRDKQRDLAEYQQMLRGAKEHVQECAYRCGRMRILADEDKTLSNVEFLIQMLESGRADSLKEALNLMDANNHRMDLYRLQRETAQMEAQRRAQFEADQAWHNLNMEYEARRKNNELEKIRKALEE